MCGLDRHRVHHGVDGHAGEHFLLFEGNAQTVECLDELGVDLVDALRPFFFLRGGVVAYGLIVDVGDVEMRPAGHLEGRPVAVGFQTEVEKPVGFSFFPGNKPDDVFVEAALDDVAVDI